MKPSRLRSTLVLLACVTATAAATHGARAGPAKVEGMHVDLSELDFSESESLIRELRRTDRRFRLKVDSSNRPTGTIITDPADLKVALDRLVAQGQIHIVGLESLGGQVDLSELASARFDRGSVAQFVGGSTAADGIETLYLSELARCGTNPTCRQGVDSRYPGATGVLQQLRSGSVDCERASLRYSRALQAIADAKGSATLTQASRLRERGAELDNACLSAPWDPDGPEVARSGGGPAAQGALNATALIEIEGTDQPFCGGLFLSPNEVVTTLHCFTRADEYEALRDGRVVVRQMGTGQATPAAAVAWTAAANPLPPTTLIGRQNIPVGEDLIRLRLAGGPAAIPRYSAVAPRGFSRAFVPGYFQTHDSARGPAGSTGTWSASTPEWWKGVRWAKPGTCLVVDTENDCFRMMCQTTHGYSGTPVFATERDSSGALILYGLVKGTEGQTNICRPQPLAFSTLGIRSSSR